MNISNNKILITGGLGFIGNSIVRKLLNYNKITIIDNQDVHGSPLSKSGKIDHENLTIKNCSIENSASLDDIDNDYGYIIHLAAILGVSKVSSSPMYTMKVNSVGTMNILELALRQKNLKKFMFFSTSEVYGPECSSVNENTFAQIPLEGLRWNYSCSKVFGEYLVKSVAHEKNMPYVIIRPFNVYGPYRLGENAMSQIIKKALNNEDILISGNGEQLRAWCHIEDFSDGVISALSSESSINQAFNIGNDNQLKSMKDLSKKIVDLTNSKSRIVISYNQIEDVQNRSPDIEKARNLLGYSPKIDLHEGILNTVDWMKSNFQYCR